MQRMNTSSVIAGLWADAGMDASALARLQLTGQDPVLPSSFAVGCAAQAAIAAAALAATEVASARQALAPVVSVDMRAAAAECTGYFQINGRVPPMWDKLSGLYRGANGWLRIHANFAHHRDGALRLLGLDEGPDTPRAAAEAVIAQRDVFELEVQGAQAGLVMAAVRRFDEWDAAPQAQALAAQDLITWERIGDAPPLPLSSLAAQDKPLAGIRVLDLTRILAGPTAGRTLATYGAEVLLVNAPHLPNIDSIIDTSRGKLSCHVDLLSVAGQQALVELLRGANIYIQGYRPGGLQHRGFGPQQAAALRPGIVCVSLSAYGHQGPWAHKRGFDSLVQTATGFNHAEALAAGSETPRALPAQILDYATGFLMAFAAQAALLRQAREGGSWHVRLSLARTALWLRGLGRVEAGLACPKADLSGYLETSHSGWGELRAAGHAARFSPWPDAPLRPSMPPGTHAARWGQG